MEILVSSSILLNPREGNGNSLQYILAWRIPWTEEPGEPIERGVAESGMTEQLTHTHTTQQGRGSINIKVLVQFLKCNKDSKFLVTIYIIIWNLLYYSQSWRPQAQLAREDRILLLLH